MELPSKDLILQSDILVESSTSAANYTAYITFTHVENESERDQVVLERSQVSVNYKQL